MAPELRIIGIQGIPEVRRGDDLGGLIVQAAQAQSTPVQAQDILVVTQKVVSKAEGRVLDLGEVEPSPFACHLGRQHQRDPRLMEVILRESRRIVKMERGILITETHHGFICANAGVDASNLPGEDLVSLLPQDPDASAQAIRERVRNLAGVEVAVIVSDTFGRPWRDGTTEVAVGVAGLNPLKDYRGTPDASGRLLRVTVVAVADELASASELVRGKVAQAPVAIVRGYPYQPQEGTARTLVRDPGLDLFR